MCVKAFNKIDVDVKQYVYWLLWMLICDQKLSFSGLIIIYCCDRKPTTLALPDPSLVNKNNRTPSPPSSQSPRYVLLENEFCQRSREMSHVVALFPTNRFSYQQMALATKKVDDIIAKPNEIRSSLLLFKPVFMSSLDVLSFQPIWPV